MINENTKSEAVPSFENTLKQKGHTIEVMTERLHQSNVEFEKNVNRLHEAVQEFLREV